jgi:mannonate dehydratase
MVTFAEMLPPYPNRMWTLTRQMAVAHAVTGLPRTDGGRQARTPEGIAAVKPSDRPWDRQPIADLCQRFADAGLTVAVIESSPPMDQIRLGLPGREAEIEHFATMLQSMGAARIPVVCWNWMAQFGWLRTSMVTPGRGGALVSSFDYTLVKDAPLTAAGVVSEEALWENLHYFLERIVPVAEESRVYLALHPDDPPLSPIRGVGRIMRSVENFDRFLDLVPSPYNGITLCQGNFALMTPDMPRVIRHFAERNAIHFVHFRDVRGTPERFEEVFHDEGQTDMLAAMRTYLEVGFDGPMRLDHAPSMEGDPNDHPGYETLGRLFATGYMTGLREAAIKELARR